jgi:ankyrin repeat protein
MTNKHSCLNFTAFTNKSADRRLSTARFTGLQEMSMDEINSQKKMVREEYDGYNEFYAVYKSEDDNDQNYFADDNPLSKKVEERRCEFSGDLGEQMKKSMMNSNLDDDEDYIYQGTETKETVEIRSQLQKTQDELAMFQLKVANLEEEKRLLQISTSVAANDIDPIRLTPTRIYLPDSHFPSSSSAYKDVDIDIFDFVSKGNLESLKNVLAASPNIVFAVNSEGRTALHLACMNNLLVIVKLLIQNYADLNAKDAGGQTPLHLCSDPGIVDVLCTRGARTSIRDNHGFTAIYVHTLHSRVEVIQSLLLHSADPMLEQPEKQRNALHCAAEIGNFTVVSILLLQSTVVLSLDAQDINGDTALHLTARNKKHELESEQGSLQQKCLMLFLDRGSQVNIQNKRGDAPLHLICANRSLRSCMAVAPLVEILLEMLADPNALDHDGCTPLMICKTFIKNDHFFYKKNGNAFLYLLIG